MHQYQGLRSEACYQYRQTLYNSGSELEEYCRILYLETIRTLAGAKNDSAGRGKTLG